MRDYLLLAFIVAFIVGVFINLGALLYRTLSENRLLEKCTEKKEFILDRTVVKCEIIKDFR